MRIAYVSADRGIPLFGAKGASIHVREMVSAFASLGHDVTVFTPSGTGPRGDLDARVVAVDEPPALELEPGADVDAKTRLKERRSMAVAQRVLDALIDAHEREPFDLVYERYSLFSAAGVRAARRLSVPCLVEVNAPLVYEQKQFRKLQHEREAQAIEVEVFGGADGLLAVSEEVGAYARSRGAATGAVHVVRNGVDTQCFAPGVTPTPPPAVDGQFVIGFAGSLKPWHGIEPLLDAFRTLAAVEADCHLLIVGDGPMRDWIGGYVRGAELDERVTVTGWVPYEGLPGMLAAMDVAVAPYPALEDFYFSPLKLYEYMAMGRCVVASRIGQVAEVIEHERTGLLVEPGDVEQLTHALGRLRRDAELRARLETGVRTAGCVNSWRDNASMAMEIAAQCGPSMRKVV